MKAQLLLFTVFNFILLIACSQSPESQLVPQNSEYVVYGTDDRKDYNEVKDPDLKELARSTVALISKEHMIYDEVFDVFHLEKPEISPGLCSDEPFHKQPTWAFCSGSLIAPDLILTAGHCVFDLKTCQDAQIVFDYQLEGRDHHFDTVKGANAFKCKEIIYSTEKRSGADFALIRLDRAVQGRTPLPLSDREVNAQDRLMLIGHPAGYPIKFTFDGALRREQNNEFITIEIDAFSGNSGSAVFDQQTHRIVGVLARGEADYDRKNKCLVSKVCDKEACRGEDVTRAAFIKTYIPKN